MKINEVYCAIDAIAPFNTQMDFDNAGLLIGDKTTEVIGIVVTLDVTRDAIEFAKNKDANLIVTHHPVIFNPIKSIESNSLVSLLIKNNIAVISAHTNLDMACGGVNDCLASVLGLSEVAKIIPYGTVYEARIGKLEKPLLPIEFAAYLKEKLKAPVKYTDSKKPITTVGICSGSGGDLLKNMSDLGVDAFVTADIKHSVFIEADASCISIFDCGHINTEDVVIEPFKCYLEKELNTEVFSYHADIIKHI